jgi:dipeptidyl aminopeptidase/acylaminoacyl peptidase
MLRRHGFSVLLIDLREQGDSTVDTGHYAGGIKEYRDVLGAWDWLQSAQHVPAAKIGLLGMSLGAATVMIATGEEPRVAATWEDSGFADINVAIQDELIRNGYPTWLSLGGILAGRIFHGIDITSLSPLQAAAKLHGRPVFIVHGDADTRLPVKHAYTLAAAIRAAGGTVEPWILPGVKHVQAVFDEPAEYERRLVQFFSESLGVVTSSLPDNRSSRAA